MATSNVSTKKRDRKSVRVDWFGDQVYADLHAKFVNAGRAAVARVEQTAHAIAPVFTGETEASIKSKFKETKRGFTGTINTNTKSGWWEEIGTGDTPEHRFMRSSFSGAYRDFEQDLQNLVR